ncbi:MAG: DUF4388 domain-containing protein [Desulforegulaceae bacterium]|nr:DUF4388 domain-containing protein [Desulforegulaceae bacterium]
MSDKLEGKITGINLTNFLQIVQMEKPTVTLLVATGNKKGSLYIENGEIIDADTKTGLKHLDAAYEIISWDNSSIELKKNMPITERIIKMPLMNILMEALRLKDEKPKTEEEEFDDLEISVEEDEEQSDDLTSKEESQDQILEEINFQDSNESFNNIDEITFTQESFPKTHDNLSLNTNNLDNKSNLHENKHKLSETENTLEKYDLRADITPPISNVRDFTDYIDLSKPENKKNIDGEIKKPSIEDFIEKKDPTKRIILISTLVLLLITSFAAGSYFYLHNKKIKTEYNNLLTNLEKMDYEDQKINLLKKFISSYPKSDYAKKAQSNLDSILKRTQKESFELMSEKIKKLPIDKNYEERAKRYYDNFLQRFPEGQYSQKAKSELEKIPDLIRQYELEQIQQIPESSTNKKIEEIKKFKLKYPGINLDEINEMEIKLGTYFFKTLEIQIQNVNSLGDFESVKNKINSFKEIFPNHPDNYKTSRLLKKLEDDKWSKALLNTAKNQSNSIEEEKQFLKNYIKSYDKYILVSAANERIREIDQILNEKEKFDNLMSYASNSSYSYSNRINRLKAYVHSDIPNDYKNKANIMIEKLQNDYSSQFTKSKPAETEKEVVKIKAKDINEMLKDASSKAESAAQKISDSSRFFRHGTFSFKDNLTGKTWLLLDSDDFSDKDCFYFKDALETAKKINIDGYSDWRLPSEQELLSLFKNKPFFPIEKNKWYWSNDIFEKGFNTYSAVITGTQTEEREKLSKNIFTDCGIFKAVRP